MQTESEASVHAARDRRSRIVEIVRQVSTIDVQTLGARLAVTQATLRRDLRLLEAQGSIRRSYGEITAVQTSTFETPLTWRSSSETEEKRAVAAAAVASLDGEASIYIDEGFVPNLIAELLPVDRSLTIVTPSLPVAARLAAGNRHEVLLLGGRVRGRTLGAVDHWARDMLAGFSLDIGFLGANGVTYESGLTTPDPAVAAIKAMAVRVCRRRVFVGDHTKFGVTSFARFATVDDIDLFITGDKLPLAQVRHFTQGGANLHRV